MDWYCLDCGSTGYKHVRYRIGGGLVLGVWIVAAALALLFGAWWLLGLAVLLSVVRAFATREACGACGSAKLVPANSPAAVAMRRQLANAAVAPAAARDQ